MTVIGQGFRACSNFKTLNRVGLGSRHARPGRLIRTMSTGHLERTAAEPRNKVSAIRPLGSIVPHYPDKADKPAT